METRRIRRLLRLRAEDANGDVDWTFEMYYTRDQVGEPLLASCALDGLSMTVALDLGRGWNNGIKFSFE